MPEEPTTRDPVDTVRLYFQTIASDWDFGAVAAATTGSCRMCAERGCPARRGTS
jgi:hypothetical protein